MSPGALLGALGRQVEPRRPRKERGDRTAGSFDPPPPSKRAPKCIKNSAKIDPKNGLLFDGILKRFSWIFDAKMIQLLKHFLGMLGTWPKVGKLHAV